ncbi:fungal-specific transcription factor domain-containing protein [Colletotrichum godetiae]|uniref:Fungal-specific transcription factor domain-containing protein n=1 Tax=Colletotrichum godetiae TaxID=1209918 RepID=A0AAJ0EVK8_9PEZI|nr:fungal-specific transcription factor domain-containing protein [Colletotrichum godetiae]KAK1673360.1 fungal-specific transcription factor domain-containing protein [Colletotrichum godetiae]
MASHPSPSQPGSAAANYKRASRRGAPRRFVCEHPGCDKLYSRAEHLQRHQLNHNPKEIFICDMPGCDQKFVRADLLSRHKKRHSSSYIPRNRAPSFASAASGNLSGPAVSSPTSGAQSRPAFPQPSTSGPHDAAILLTPESATPTPTTGASNSSVAQHVTRISQPATWPSIDDMAAEMMRSKPAYYGRDQLSLPEAPPLMPAFDPRGFQPDEALSRENFAVWLFDSQASFSDFNGVADLPFLEGGLESTFNNNIHYDYESLTSRSQLDPSPPRQVEVSDELISEHRRQEVLRWLKVFRHKQPKYEPRIVSLVQESNGDLPALSLEMMRDCLQEYWKRISPRLPIVHQPTFSSNRCSIFLLLVMVALGAASLSSRDSTGNLEPYGGLADVIISSSRWEILTHEEASAPVGLSIAQAMLLLEFYEKIFSSRRMHERSHIYHSALLNLLRRGSPLIGRAGSESPPEEEAPAPSDGPSSDSRTWWVRWAESESMHRVVFAAFMMDTVHAAMFGHNADMAPHEIRLPLPCDDGLWTAATPGVFRQLDGNYRMYGIKQVSFLDGLKSALHGQEVKTHTFGRMIIMSGLLSVGWHLSRRESHLKWLDLRTPSTETHDSWKKILFRAFDEWKESFDNAVGANDLSEGLGQPPSSNGPIHSAAVLYHLAHISLHVDIVDCQVYAGAKRLVGRKVSTRDHANAVARMRTWSNAPSTRHAVLHAFKLLYKVLVDHKTPKRRTSSFGALPEPVSVYYSCRSESDPHRPWIMYYAALTIWSFVQALGIPNRNTPPGRLSEIARYLARFSSLEELNEEATRDLNERLPELLDLLETSLKQSHSELLREASERLKLCREMLV